MTVVERMARAIYETQYGDPGHWELIAGYQRAACTNAAIAALKAVREPSKAMIDAAGATDGMKEVSDMVVVHQIRTGYRMKWDVAPFTQGWHAAIDAAIAEHEGWE